MKLKIEAIAELVPYVRAEIARELVLNHNLSQQEVSSLLRVSQPAISQYVRRLRGSKYQDEAIRNEIKAICDKLLKGLKNDLETDIYNICKTIAESKKSNN